MKFGSWCLMQWHCYCLNFAIHSNNHTEYNPKIISFNDNRQTMKSNYNFAEVKSINQHSWGMLFCCIWFSQFATKTSSVQLHSDSLIIAAMPSPTNSWQDGRWAVKTFIEQLFPFSFSEVLKEKIWWDRHWTALHPHPTHRTDIPQKNS